MGCENLNFRKLKYIFVPFCAFDINLQVKSGRSTLGYYVNFDYKGYQPRRLLRGHMPGFFALHTDSANVLK